MVQEEKEVPEEPVGNSEEDSVSDSDEKPAGESDEEALLSRRLAKSIYGGRPTKLQQRIIDYLIQMRKKPAPNIDDFIAFVGVTHPNAEEAVTKGWERVKRFFSADNQEKHLSFAGLADVPGFIAAFQLTPTLDAPTAGVACTPPQPMPACSRRIAQNRAHRNSDSYSDSDSDDDSNGGSKSSGSGDSNDSNDSRHLTPVQVAQMQATFKSNFNKFQGSEWLLPSGASFDRVLYDAIKDLRYECSLHSFVIDDPAFVLGLFPDTRDQDELRKVLMSREGEVLPALSSAEKAFLGMYKMDPKDLEELYAKKGWSAVGESMAEQPSDEFQRLVHECLNLLLAVYRRGRMAMPQTPHESWIVNHLWGFLAEVLSSPRDVEIRPGEYHSLASMYRRNLDRPAHAYQFVGHKVDGVAIAAPLRFEILAIEASNKDEGPNTVKAVKYRMKLCKLTKDMHDYIRNKTKGNIREQLATFGIQISGEEAGFFTLRQRCGRFYQLCHEGSETLPSIWVEELDTQIVLNVLAKALTIRKSLLSMVKTVRASVGTKPSPDDHDIDHIAATMMSPQLTPMRPPPIDEEAHELQL